VRFGRESGHSRVAAGVPTPYAEGRRGTLVLGLSKLSRCIKGTTKPGMILATQLLRF